jgi:hypothetical protein
MEKQKCKQCNIEKELRFFSYRKERNSYRKICKDCLAKKMRIIRNGTSEFVYREPKNEWQKPDTLYISLNYNKYVPSKLPIPKICSYDLCKCSIINVNYKYIVSTKLNGATKYYCSEWCMENDNPPEIKHICKYCDVATNPIISKRHGRIIGWRTLCDDCLQKKKENVGKNIKPRKSRAKKVYDNVGHKCKKCGIYKNWDMFGNQKRNPNGKSYTCKVCHHKMSVEYYHKYQDKINKLKNKYYHLRKLKNNEI